MAVDIRMGQWSDSEEDNAERDASGKESAHSTEQNQRSIRSSVGRLRSLLHVYLLPRRLASLSSNSLKMVTIMYLDKMVSKK
jgi:hypothetical protein